MLWDQRIIFGTFAYAQFDQKYKLSNSREQSGGGISDYRAELKITLPYYLEYLQKFLAGVLQQTY